MAIVPINATDQVSASRAVINANFAYLASLVGSGISGSGSLTFTAIPDGTSQDQTFSLTGAVLGMAVTPAFPVLASGLLPIMFVSSSNTITVRLLNLTGAPYTLTSATFGASVAALSGVSGSSSLTFTTIPDGSSQDQTFAIAGITTGQHVTPALPALAAGLIPVMFVSAPNTITVRMFNWSGAPVTVTATFGANVQ